MTQTRHSEQVPGSLCGRSGSPRREGLRRKVQSRQHREERPRDRGEGRGREGALGTRALCERPERASKPLCRASAARVQTESQGQGTREQGHGAGTSGDGARAGAGLRDPRFSADDGWNPAESPGRLPGADSRDVPRACRPLARTERGVCSIITLRRSLGGNLKIDFPAQKLRPRKAEPSALRAWEEHPRRTGAGRLRESDFAGLLSAPPYVFSCFTNMFPKDF